MKSIFLILAAVVQFAVADETCFYCSGQGPWISEEHACEDICHSRTEAV